MICLIGTDNALAATVNIKTVFHATMAIVRGREQPLDVISVHEIDTVKRHGATDGVSSYLRVGKCLTMAHCCVGWVFMGDVLEGETVFFLLKSFLCCFEQCLSDCLESAFTFV